MNVLLDTSVWISHFRKLNTDVVRLLENELVVTHDFVVAELACGNLKARHETIGYLKALITLPTMSVDEVMTLIESKALYSRGICLIDAQLLASILVTPDTLIWTFDYRLEQVAIELGISYAAN